MPEPEPSTIPLIRRLLCVAGLLGNTAYFADAYSIGQHCLTCSRVVECADRKPLP